MVLLLSGRTLLERRTPFVCKSCTRSHWNHKTARRSVLEIPNRLSKYWIPTGGIAESKNETAHDLLVRAGFVRTAYAGMFHFLPLGERVIRRLENLIDAEMQNIGACKLELSTFSSESLWNKTGRLAKGGAELFRIKDRKDQKFLLSPTHEEEITQLVAGTTTSYKQLPLRLYQITRKYRDERRPRAGLLRGKEFLMKDLYTFDDSAEAAKKTYDEVIEAYHKIFQKLGIPFLMAEADTGDMGGTLSHEFVFPSPHGEDLIASCDSCEYTANTEVGKTTPSVHENLFPEDIAVYAGISLDRRTLVQAFYPKKSPSGQLNEINVAYLRHLFPELDPTLSTSPLPLFEKNFVPPTEDNPSKVLNIFDTRIPTELAESTSSFSGHSNIPSIINSKSVPTSRLSPPEGGLHLTKLQTGDACPNCSGTLTLTQGIEVAHAFYLSQRYSQPLNAKVETPEGKVFMEMGCYGIGVSRILAAAASAMMDDKGLVWPRAIAPYEVLLIPYDTRDRSTKLLVHTARALGSEIRSLTATDDRNKSLGWKLKDADLIGYPSVVIIGKDHGGNNVEYKDRKTGETKIVPAEQLIEIITAAREAEEVKRKELLY